MGCRRLVAEDPYGWLRGDPKRRMECGKGSRRIRDSCTCGAVIMECNIGTVSGRKRQIAAEFGRQSESRD